MKKTAFAVVETYSLMENWNKVQQCSCVWGWGYKGATLWTHNYPMATQNLTNGDYSDYPDIAKDPDYVHFILVMKAQGISNSF